MSKIVVDTIESTGATVTVNDALTTGTNAITAGSVTGLTATSITSGTLGAGATVGNASLSAGTIIQVVTVVKSDIDVMTQAADTYTTVMTGTITPSSTSNHILIFVNMAFSQDSARYANLHLYRDSTQVGLADADGSRTRAMVSTNTDGSSDAQHTNFSSAMTFKDSPSSTSALSYTLRLGSINAPSGNQLIVNSSGDNVNSSYTVASISNLILMEVKG